MSSGCVVDVNVSVDFTVSATTGRLALVDAGLCDAAVLSRAVACDVRVLSHVCRRSAARTAGAGDGVSRDRAVVVGARARALCRARQRRHRPLHVRRHLHARHSARRQSAALEESPAL